MLALFFALGRFLNVFWVLLLIFFLFIIDFEWILGGFGEGCGKFWMVFEGISRLFFAFLPKIAIL